MAAVELPTARRSNSVSKICLVAHFAYGALHGGRDGHVGGVERQMSILGPWLAARGHDVTLLTWDEGQPDNEVIKGVRVIKICKQSDGLPLLRFFHPRWTGLIKAMRQADADVYYQNCAEVVTGQVGLWCKRNKRRFVYSVASDPDCDASLRKFRKLRERVLYRQGLQLADTIIVQSRFQQDALKSGFGLDSQILRMPVDAPAAQAEDLKMPEQPRVLWVGRLVTVKRLEWLLDVSELCPDVHFDVVGPEYETTDVARNNLSRMEGAKNVTYHGRVPLEEMPAYYQRASMLLCTSVFEGFPNTFIEAWSNGRPVVSTVDPDTLLTRKSLGKVFAEPTEAARQIQALARNTALWQTMSRNALTYFNEEHETSAAIPRFEHVLSNEAVTKPDQRQ